MCCGGDVEVVVDVSEISRVKFEDPYTYPNTSFKVLYRLCRHANYSA